MTETEHVPDGSMIGPTSRASGSATEHVPDLPRFGRFQALAELGAGAMGTVYRAQDDVLGRAVAIKTLHATNAPGVRERFLREARAIGAVHHANILGIYDAGSEGDTPYLVMELATGGSLRDRIKAGPLPLGVVRVVGIQIARALAAAHAANILHRDVKPANILCTGDGAWKLADFGIARLPDSTLTITGQFLGSPSYAAPESLRSGEFSPASDVYGLGATLYEALSGAPPYGDRDMQSLIRKLEQDPTPLRELVAVPGPVGDAIMAALSRDPRARPSAEQLANMLTSTADAPRAVALPVPPVVAARSRKRSLLWAALVGAALLVTYLATRSSSSRAQPASAFGVVPRQGTTESDPTVPTPDQASGAADPNADPQPRFVDENGNPVDEETARKLLDEMKRDDDERRGPGRGHHKHKPRGD